MWILLNNWECPVWADEDPVDPKKYLEDSCKPKCVKPLLEYQACVKRIQGDEGGHKHCTGQYFDYWSCVDKCCTKAVYEVEVIKMEISSICRACSLYSYFASNILMFRFCTQYGQILTITYCSDRTPKNEPIMILGGYSGFGDG
ncbi:hypothetical protein AQUCO_00400400v1 [Aquilegia coerulea]|uniref:Complex III subunit VI n=1 Tax=Aquilegia coerulea TaxID=218851 RepID=A0A2G5EUR3_AQUCA|nr:hypothetical protein AQUCO_00400400v1 [Aquilegia coerulea]